MQECTEQITNTDNKCQTANNFNIFSILGIEANEVIICRFIGELLNPNGRHGLGSKPLEEFLEVLHYNYNNIALEKATVFLEKKIDNNRRVDIVIYLSNQNVIPIEVKVWAKDQVAQLSDYFEYYKNKYHTEHIYYLTPTGWKPSSKSNGDFTVTELTEDKNINTEKGQIICISFEKNITEWLNKIIEWLEKDKCDSEFDIVKGAIIQFKEVIENMCEKTTILDNLKKQLGLNYDETSTEPKDEKINLDRNTAIDILANADALSKAIKIQYLMTHIKIPKDYVLRTFEEKNKKEIDDNHAMLRVCHNGSDQAIAWICVHENLYIAANNINEESHNWKKEKESYYWQYISPEGKEKKFNLKDISKTKTTGEIEIEYLLNDIIINNSIV